MLIKIKRGGVNPGSGHLWSHLAKSQSLRITSWTRRVCNIRIIRHQPFKDLRPVRPMESFQSGPFISQAGKLRFREI